MKTPNDKLERNYRNFGLTLLIIIVLIFGIGFITQFLEFPKPNYSSGYNAGLKIGKTIRWYVDSGLFFGNVFAFLASMEKKNPLYKAIFHSLFGWAYVVYYALTRKTVIENTFVKE